MNLLLGDCLEQLKTLPDNSIDSVVTDPPYGLAFMGKKWDYDVPSVEIWREVLRVLRPGGHLLSFGGTRTYHRMVVAIEDAGFEVRDQIMWIYGSGFPKSLNVGKAIDKQNGVDLEVVGKGRSGASSRAYQSEEQTTAGEYEQTKSNNEWSGWGTALKPANEPIVLARKPLIGTVAQNVLKHGTGALNIDASRIGYSESENVDFSKVQDGNIYGGNGIYGEAKQKQTTPLFKENGRWPANVIFDEEAAQVLDEQSGVLRARGNKTAKDHGGKYNATSYEFGGKETGWAGDSGGASRFFYVAKASKRERNAGLEGMPKKIGLQAPLKTMSDPRMAREQERRPNENHHPTVKPLKLMQYLVRMVTPPGGTVLDPFMGSGSTGCAAISLGFDFIGCELSPEYFEIARKRIEGATFSEAA